MKETIPRLFTDIAAKLEDMHAIAVDGQRPDNNPDMQRALTCHLRMGVASLDTSLAKINRRLGDGHE